MGFFDQIFDLIDIFYKLQAGFLKKRFLDTYYELKNK